VAGAQEQIDAQDSYPGTQPEVSQEAADFSLVLGGPIFQLFRKSHLAGDGLELLRRRLLIITLVAWLPPLFLATLGSITRNSGGLSFFHDVEVHIRFLVALPVLVAAELVVHSRLGPVVRRFIERGIIFPEELRRFHCAIETAIKLRNSIPVECGLLLLVYTLGLWAWNRRPELSTSTWYALPTGHWHLTYAGFWYVFISIPIFQFILLRWYLRLFIWFRFLWHVSRLNLHLIPTHPDRSAGLAFLGRSAYAFSPILFAQGAMLAGVIAARVLYRGENFLSYKIQVVGFVALFVLVILGPLLMFTPSLARAKRKGLADYGLLAQRYVDGFEQKWVLASVPNRDELLGTGDIQSLADLANGYALVRDMRPVPFGMQDISHLALATAAPLLPLLLTIFSPDELILRVIKIIF